MSVYRTAIHKANEFIRDEAGVAVVDWVALVASMILFGIALLYAIFNTGVAEMTKHVNVTLATGLQDVDTGDVDSLVAQNQGTGG